MKTVFRTQYGGPEVLAVVEREIPKLRGGQVLVRVHASTVNRTDCGGLWGKPFVFRFFAGFPKPRYAATGSDFAGEIVDVASDVTGFQKGERVFGFLDHGIGSHAQFMAFDAKGPMGKIPTGVSYDDAVASLEGAHYARNFINKVKLAPGQKVLVYGATGAIGSAAVQLLRSYSVDVTAVCHGDHRERVAALGPNRVIDYTQTDYSRENVQYDFVFDAVGKSTFGDACRVLTPRGIYISSELGPGNENLWLAASTPFKNGRRVIFPIPVHPKATVDVMAGLLGSKQFRPLIDRHYAIEEIREAFEYVASGRKIGNVLLTLSN